jgi:hypothetical protein
MLDPVISPLQVFAIPDNFNPDTLTADVTVKYNGLPIPLVQNGRGISTVENRNLEVKNYTISLNGITMTVLSHQSDYTDFTIRCKIFDEDGKVIKEDYQSSGVSGNSIVTLSIPCQNLNPFKKYLP